MKFCFIIGRMIYSVAKLLPASYSVGGGIARALRNFSGRLILHECGENVNIERKAYFTRLCSLGDNSGLGINCFITGPVTIGKNVLMGPNVQIYTSNHKFDDLSVPIGQQGNEEAKPVIIEDDCWLAANVIILPGVTIGTGSVIGAGAVVAKSVPPYSICVGNPAKVIKSRNK